jgi:hypothetical protein
MIGTRKMWVVAVPFLRIAIFSILMYSLNISLTGIIFSLTFIILTAKKTQRIDLSLIYLISVFLTMNLLRLLDIANFALLALVFFGVITICGIWKKSDEASNFSKNLMSSKFIDFLLPILLVVLIATRDGSSRVFYILTKFGYDQVGHFAMSKALSVCSGFLTHCDPDSKMLPFNYMYYPQQWHILFSIFMNNEDLNTSISSFIGAVIMSTAISLYLVFIVFHVCVNEIKDVTHKKGVNIEKLLNPIFALVVIIIFVLSFLGYPNFVFAVSLFLSAITLNKEKNVFHFILGVALLMIVISSYTLLLVPASLYYIYLLSRAIQSKLKSIYFGSIIIFMAFVYEVIITATSHSHLDFISIGAGKIDPLVLVVYSVSIFSAALTYKALKMPLFLKSATLTNLSVINMLVLFSLLGLHGILIVGGNGSGYYLQKMAYFALIIGLLNIGIALQFQKLERNFLVSKVLKFNFNLTTLVLIFSVFLWSIPQLYFAYSRLPIRSPLSNVMTILIGEDADVKRMNFHILKAAEFSITRRLPVVILSENTGPDTQWVNSLSGHWSGYLNNYLEDSIDNQGQFRNLDFQLNNDSIILFYDPLQGLLNE